MKQYTLTRPVAALFLLSALVAVTSGCARTPAQKYAKFFAAGTAQLNKHDYARAVLQFRSAIQVNPKSADAYYQLALAYQGAGDTQTAVKCLWKTLQLNPKYTAADLKLSELAVATRNPAEAREAEGRIKHVLKESPENANALDVLAKAEWQLGKQQEAEKLLNQAFADSPKDLKLSADLAQVKLWNKDIGGAEAILKKAAANNPGSAAAAVILGRFYLAVGRSHEAEQQFEQALKLDAEDKSALLSLATIDWSTGRLNEADQLYKRAADSPDPQLKPVHAIFLFRTGKRDLAISEFEKLYKQNPSDRVARTRLIMAYQAAGRSSDVEKLLAGALKKNPKDVDALLEQTTVYLRNGNAAAAQAALTTALHFQPDSAQAHFLLAAVHRMRGESELQKQELTQAVQLNPNLLPARLQLAEWLVSHKGAKEAREVLNETPAAQKNDLAVLIHENWADLALGDRTAARNGIDRVLARDHQQPEPLVQDATLRMMDRDFADARHSLEEALRKTPDNAEAVDLMVQTYTLEKQIPAGAQWLRQYAAQRPKSAPVQFELGRVLMSTGDFAGARVAFNTAKAADPALTAADLYLAQLDVRDGKLDQARQRLSGIVSKRPTDLPAHLLLGNVEQIAQNYQGAIDQYRKAVGLDDTNAEALNDLAYALAEYGKQPDAALQYAQAAEELAPSNPSVADTLGWVLYRKALYTSAIPYLEQAAAHDPTGVRECHLALAYLRAGDQRKGRQALAAALKLDPSLPHSELSQEIAASQSVAR
jgi:tetratricopeptide (TPR) repeat protein